MIAEKLHPKGNTNSAELRKGPQFEQIVNYINYGQETVMYPDRQAKLIRNHPFMTQLDFFDTQEDQERAWAEQVRQREAVQLAGAMGLTATQARAGAGPAGRIVDGRTPYGDGAGRSGGGGGDYGPAGRRLGRGGGAGPIGDGGAPQSMLDLGPQPPGTEYGPIHDGGHSSRVGPMNRPTAERENARRIASQDTQTNDAGSQLLNDTLMRITETINRVNERRKASARAAAASLAAAAPAGTSSAPVGRTTVDIMDAHAQARQDAATQADDQMNDRSLRPVDRRPEAKAKPRPMSKAQKTDTGITKQRTIQYDRSSEAKKVNRAVEPQPTKMARAEQPTEYVTN